MRTCKTCGKKFEQTQVFHDIKVDQDYCDLKCLKDRPFEGKIHNPTSKEKKIVDYIIVNLSNIQYNPQQEIDELLKEGYQPHGFPYSTENQYSMIMTYQAMVKYEEKEDA